MIDINETSPINVEAYKLFLNVVKAKDAFPTFSGSEYKKLKMVEPFWSPVIM